MQPQKKWDKGLRDNFVRKTIPEVNYNLVLGVFLATHNWKKKSKTYSSLWSTSSCDSVQLVENENKCLRKLFSRKDVWESASGKKLCDVHTFRNFLFLERNLIPVEMIIAEEEKKTIEWQNTSERKLVRYHVPLIWLLKSCIKTSEKRIMISACSLCSAFLGLV